MKKTIDYQTKKAELDAILGWFEREDVSIDEALTKYEQANKLILELETYLSDTRVKISRLSQKIPNKKI